MIQRLPVRKHTSFHCQTSTDPSLQPQVQATLVEPPNPAACQVLSSLDMHAPHRLLAHLRLTHDQRLRGFAPQRFASLARLMIKNSTCQFFAQCLLADVTGSRRVRRGRGQCGERRA
jgi:hypothetical protein